MKCFLNLFPDRTGIFSAVNKNLLCCSLEDTTLCSHWERSASCQNGIRIGRVILPITLNQHTPGAKLLPAYLFDGYLLLFAVGVLDGLFFHGLTQGINIRIRNAKPRTQSLIEIAVAAFKHQLFDHVFVGKAGGSGNTDIYAAFSAQCLDIIGALSAFGDFDHNHSFSINGLQSNIRYNGWFTAIRHGICNGIHGFEYIFLTKADYFSGFICNSENDFAAGPIGKGNYGLHVFDTSFRKVFFELYILGFPCENFFYGHNSTSSSLPFGIYYIKDPFRFLPVWKKSVSTAIS